MPLSKTELYRFLKAQRYAVVSTVAKSGAPQSALVGFAVNKDIEIVFDTTASTRKIANLRARPRVSLVIGWDNEQSAQIEGVADEPDGADLTRIRKLYFAAFPDGRERLSWAGITHVRVRPTWIRFSDYNRKSEIVRELSFA